MDVIFNVFFAVFLLMLGTISVVIIRLIQKFGKKSESKN
jgi:uncharacterized YccA/Bax inhibitor family protein